VTPEQAQKVLLATNIGKLSLVLRQPGDDNTVADRRVTERDLNRGKTLEPVKTVAPPPPPAPAPPPRPPTAKVPDTATVAIVRGVKREEYNVQRSRETRQGIPRDHKLHQSSLAPRLARSTPGPHRAVAMRADQYQAAVQTNAKTLEFAESRTGEIGEDFCTAR
jgi:Flp pilus assembly protein CpaB